MALDFSATQTDNTITVDNFLGLDYNTFETETDLRRSKLAKNMIVNQNGYVEKRTGYKRVFDDSSVKDRINGIFTYHAKYDSITDDTVTIEDINIIHIGTKLYRFHFENGIIIRDEELFTGLENKKTRAFEFGGSLYIIGGGYVKVGIDELTKRLCCCRVMDFYTKANYNFQKNTIDYDAIKDLDTVVVNRNINALDGEVRSSDTTKIFKAITFNKGASNFGVNSKEKFLLAKKEDSSNYSVRDVIFVRKHELQGEEVTEYRKAIYYGSWEPMFEIKSDDEYGTYVKLKTYVLDAAWQEIQNAVSARIQDEVNQIIIVFTENNMVYSPLVVNDRTPMWVKNLDNDEKWAEDSSDENTRYTGKIVEGVNLLNNLQAVQFYVNKSSDTTANNAMRFYLAKKGISAVTKIMFNDYIWHFTASEYVRSYIGINEEKGYLDISRGAFPFNEGTITVYFTTDEGKEDNPIDKCSIFGIYGGDNDTRVFLSGNEEYPCRDWASGLYDATFFSDIMYTDVGGDNSRIIGYHKFYSNQIIIKDGNGESATQYLRSYSTDADGKAVYSILQGNDSYSANCVSSFKNIGGYPFYIGEDGLYMMYGTNVKAENNTACKSLLINEKFTKEDTANMICITHEGRFYAYTKNQMYICDTHRDYEWYYFDGLPEITCLWTYNDLIFFGDTAGKVYRFMKEDEKHAYCDDVSADGKIENAKPIHAIWTIPQNTYNSYTNYKTIRNLHISCMPYDRSSVVIYYNSDEDLADEVLNESIDMFYWENIDFSRFSFVTIKAPQAFATRVKLKNVYTFGITLENNAIDEPFGFIGLTMTYRTGKKVK